MSIMVGGAKRKKKKEKTIHKIAARVAERNETRSEGDERQNQNIKAVENDRESHCNSFVTIVYVVAFSKKRIKHGNTLVGKAEKSENTRLNGKYTGTHREQVQDLKDRKRKE